MSNGIGLLRILRCLQKQTSQSLSIEDTMRCTNLSKSEFEEGKQKGITEGDIYEAGGFLYLEEKGNAIMNEISSAQINLKSALEKSKARSEGKLKAYEVIHRHGKFYNKTDGTRIVINEGATLSLELYTADLLDIDPYNVPLSEVDSETVLKAIESKQFYAFKKIANKGECLSFTIKAGKRIRNDSYAIQCDFVVRLLSDLYMFWKTPDTINGLVFDCACVAEYTNGHVHNFEPIYRYSLNDVYTKTFEWYFGLYGKSTINIYNNFRFMKTNSNRLLGEIRVFGLSK